MLTPHEIIGVALDQLTQGLLPFFLGELQAAYGDHWRSTVRGQYRGDRSSSPSEELTWDSHALLTVMWDHWNAVFRRRLGLFERSLVSELREFRNLWAHQAALTEDDAYRVLDTVQRLLSATDGDAEHLNHLEQLKFDLLRNKLGRHVDDDLLRARFNRERWTELGLFAVAAAAVILTTTLVMIPRNPMAGLILCGFTSVAFSFIIVRRWKAAVPLHGVHECGKCRKIIYAEVCPYCESPPASLIERRTSSARLASSKNVTALRT